MEFQILMDAIRNNFKAAYPRVFALILLFVTGCRKDITLDLPKYQQKVVIEAAIETGSPAVVFLSYSVPYFGDFDYSTPEKAYIKGAKVTVSDGVFTDSLLEADPSSGYVYVGTQLRGVVGKT